MFFIIFEIGGAFVLVSSIGPPCNSTQTETVLSNLNKQQHKSQRNHYPPPLLRQPPPPPILHSRRNNHDNHHHHHHHHHNQHHDNHHNNNDMWVSALLSIDGWWTAFSNAPILHHGSIKSCSPIQTSCLQWIWSWWKRLMIKMPINTSWSPCNKSKKHRRGYARGMSVRLYWRVIKCVVQCQFSCVWVCETDDWGVDD